MPGVSARKRGQRERRDRESKLEPAERMALLHDLSQTPAAVKARAARPREDGWSAEQRKARKARKRRVLGWLTHRDDALERGWQPEQRPLTGDRLWRLLPVDILTVAR